MLNRGARYLRVVDVWSDGACKNQGSSFGPGGYGAVCVFGEAGDDPVSSLELSQGFLCTTCTRMELMAVAVALEKLLEIWGPCRIFVHTDYEALVELFYSEKVQGLLRGAKGQGALVDADLWDRIVACVRAGHEVDFSWVKGHAGIPLNERANSLAGKAASGTRLFPDKGVSLVHLHESHGSQKKKAVKASRPKQQAKKQVS